MSKIKSLQNNQKNNSDQLHELENQNGMLKLRIQFLKADLEFFNNTSKELDKQIKQLNKK